MSVFEQIILTQQVIEHVLNFLALFFGLSTFGLLAYSIRHGMRIRALQNALEQLREEANE